MKKVMVCNTPYDINIQACMYKINCVKKIIAHFFEVAINYM